MPVCLILAFYVSNWQLDWQSNIEDPEWLKLLQPFNAAKNLYLAKVFAPTMPVQQEIYKKNYNIVIYITFCKKKTI